MSEKSGNFKRRIKQFFAHDPANDQWSDTPVPISERLGVWEPTAVWIGFAIAYVVAFIGAQIYFGLGMPDAIYAIVLGNAILVIYSGALAYASAEGGLNFPLQVKESFGQIGSLIPIAIMGLLVNGWYAYQAWLAADVVRAALNPPWILIAVGLTILFGIPAILGIEAMSDVVTKVVIPLMVLSAAYMIVVKIVPAWPGILNKAAPGDSIPFMVGVGLTWGTFAVSGTATGDIVRFAENTKNALIATVVAFLICNTGMMILGAMVAATLPELSLYFGMLGVLGGIPLIIIATVSCWSTCDACHYGSTMSYTNLHPKITWRIAAVAGLIIALVAVVTGIISNLLSYLILIGLLVPPIGGIIIGEYFVLRRGDGYNVVRTEDYNLAAIATLIIAIAVNYYAFKNYQQIPTGLAGLFVGVVLYPGMNKLKLSLTEVEALTEREHKQTPVSNDD